MTLTEPDRGTATRLGRWLGVVVRVAVAAVLAGGLLGAALGAARTEPRSVLTEDLAAGRVAEVVLTDSGAYGPPGLTQRDWTPVVRWKVVGSGWRTADLTDDGSALDGTGDGSGLGGPTGDGTGPDDGTDGTAGDGSGLGGTAGDGTGAGPGGRAGGRAEVRREAVAAGVPVSVDGPVAPRRLVTWATVMSLLLVLVLIGSPQPRRATKWAWFWLMLVPGGLTQLAWLALEAPWSSRANRRPEPLPHARQPADQRLTGGHALLLALVLAGVLTVAGPLLAGWLAG